MTDMRDSNKHRDALTAIRRAIRAYEYAANRGDYGSPSAEHQRGEVRGLERARAIVRTYLEAYGIDDVPEEQPRIHADSEGGER